MSKAIHKEVKKILKILKSTHNLPLDIEIQEIFRNLNLIYCKPSYSFRNLYSEYYWNIYEIDNKFYLFTFAKHVFLPRTTVVEFIKVAEEQEKIINEVNLMK